MTQNRKINIKNSVSWVERGIGRFERMLGPTNLHGEIRKTNLQMIEGEFQIILNN